MVASNGQMLDVLERARRTIQHSGSQIDDMTLADARTLSAIDYSVNKSAQTIEAAIVVQTSIITNKIDVSMGKIKWLTVSIGGAAVSMLAKLAWDITIYFLMK